MARDSQRSKLYTAERFAFEVAREINDKIIFGVDSVACQSIKKIEDIQKLVDKITFSKWWAKEFKHNVGVTVTHNSGRTGADACHIDMRIRIATNMRMKYVVLHELAHIAANIKHNDQCSHDRRFAAAYLKLVRKYLGKEQADALRNEFKNQKVRYRPAVRNKMNPMQRKIAVERIRKYRRGV